MIILQDSARKRFIRQKNDYQVDSARKMAILQDSDQRKEFVPVELHSVWLIISNLLKLISQKLFPIQLSYQPDKGEQNFSENI